MALLLAPPSSGPAGMAGRHGAAGQVHPHDIHVLLVDDEQLSRLVVSNLLRKCEYRGAQLKRCCCPSFWQEHALHPAE